MLIEGKLDVAVTFGSRYAPHLRTQLLARDRLCLIVPAGHRLAAAESVGPRDLQDEKLIAAPASVVPVLRAAIGIYCAAGGVVPRFAFEPRLQHTIIRLVQEGLGLALIPQSLCTDLGPRAIAKSLIDAPEFDVVLCAPTTSKNPAVAPFFELAASWNLTEAMLARGTRWLCVPNKQVKETGNNTRPQPISTSRLRFCPLNCRRCHLSVMVRV